MCMRSQRRRVLRPMSVVPPLVLLATFVAAVAEERKYTIDDALSLERLGMYYGGPYAFAPDGDGLAFTRVRTDATLANLKWEFLWGNAGGDVWVQTGIDAAPVNITQGERDGSGWWAPQWSPDGRYLAMLSTRGGNVRIWLWDVQTRRARLLSQRGVETFMPHPRPFLWIDERRLLYPALPEGELPFGMRIELDTPTIATREWPKVPAGEQVTASVLDSGVTPDLDRRPHGQLRLIDVAGDRESVVVDASTVSWSIAPRRDAVAFARQSSVYTPKADEPLPFGTRGTYEVGLATLDGSSVAVDGELSRDVLPESLRWSPDGGELAFFGYAGDRTQPPRLYRLDLAERRVEAQALGELDVEPIVRKEAQLEWAAGDAGQVLLVRAAWRSGTVRPGIDARRDWWLIGGDGSRRCLSAGLEAVPEELWPEDGRRTFVGLAGGELWRLDPAAAEVENLSADFTPEIAQIAWPAYTNSGIEEWPQRERTYAQLVFAVRGEDDLSSYRIDLASGRIDALEPPDKNAELKAYAPRSGTALFYRRDSDGLYLWRRDGTSGKTRELIAANTFLRDIAAGEVRSIDYTSLDGEPLKAWLLLPPDHQEDRRYPLLTWVYAGAMAGPKPSVLTDIGFSSSLNLQIAAARGYAVLIPSMPLAPDGAVDDPMLRLPHGVLPAVDKVVQMGIADPRRLFLMGQSFGGFSTYGLVTQTDRFAAAVALAGLSDFVSLYGQFDARMRYTDQAHENLFQMALFESSSIRMGNPPWKDLWRYLRNSPIFFVDRVDTPLLIVQGDLDYVALQQGEEFFTALYRQGKRARFVRYWGEGHVLRSPANVHDLWERIFAWFDEFSPPSEMATDQNR